MMQISVYLKSGKSLEAVVDDIKISDQLIRYFDENTGNVNFSVFTKFCKIILTDKENEE